MMVLVLTVLVPLIVVILVLMVVLVPALVPAIVVAVVFGRDHDDLVRYALKGDLNERSAIRRSAIPHAGSIHPPRAAVAIHVVARRLVVIDARARHHDDIRLLLEVDRAVTGVDIRVDLNLRPRAR